MQSIDPYKQQRNLDNLIKRIKNSSISKANKKAILDFKTYCAVEGLSVSRAYFYVSKLYLIAQWLNKDFKSATKKDIMRIVEKVGKMKYTEWSKQNFRVTLKKFYKWLRNSEEYPEEVKWLKTTMKKQNDTLPEELLNEEEVKRLIEKAEHPRNKALISVLYESGCRIGEILSLRLKHVDFDKFGTVLMVTGKTGPRRVRVISSTPYLATWIDNHPLKDDPNSPLWVGIGTAYRNEIIDYAAVRLMIARVAKRAGIKKRVNPHTFRHSRATHLATRLTEAQMNELFGWVQGSEMPSTYVHLSGRDVDKTLLKIYGIETEEDKEEPPLKPKNCYRCTYLNAPTSRFCTRCGAVLDVGTAIAMEEEMKSFDEKLATLLQDEKVRKFLARRIKELS